MDGEHYDELDKSSPVACEITIRIVFVLMLMTGYWAELIDICGAFLLGEFKPEHKMYIKIPKGFEKFYPKDTVLLLNKTLYGCKQGALQFWHLISAAFKAMKYMRNKADACLQYTWTKSGHLLMWICWVDDCMIVGPKDEVLKAKNDMKTFFEVDDTGEMKEYVGMKLDIDRENRTMKMTQPVLLQSFQDEFDLPNEVPPNPAPAGEILVKGTPEEAMSKDEQSVFCSGVGKLLHVSRWTCPETLNRVRELSRFMSEATKFHFKCMLSTCAIVLPLQMLDGSWLPMKHGMAWTGTLNSKFMESLILTMELILQLGAV